MPASKVKRAALRRLNMRVIDVDALNHSHEAIVDYVVGHPFDGSGAIAEAVGYSKTQIDRILNNQAFKDRVKERRAELLDMGLIENVENHLKDLVNVSIWVIKKDLLKNEDVNVALKSLETSTSALGYGARYSGGSVVQNNYVVALPDKVANEGEWVSKHGAGAKLLATTVEIIKENEAGSVALAESPFKEYEDECSSG